LIPHIPYGTSYEPPLPYFLLFALPLAAKEPALRAALETTEAIPGQAIDRHQETRRSG
jgi:hypothetical protein